ncbi:hypothetical protein CK222_29345 [Mesorhizobium sp. WSM3866]|uniref:hypothetical protein n=1 Tax=unclassified Mesorhizobium TaxID=325217 RepID=UPI0007FD2A10|nr:MULTISPECIES: hypothetical protein [unclassified Mesorhizobium]OBQ96458.1 hypothetical protein A9K66_21115 [Mesorhizobium sp. AA23]PBB40155.1 hypothetical protein CK222_29345 [Mesorhizobium sp. WSM3866]RWH24408.1 MAG: hypothetical protein EOQ76_20545 [Mesorhizobium sp.]RWH36464.1 MAG: hypothetical protein EOQ79_17720 [Mesorhizobium sp.]TIR58226.1 MAG: hypothetical protein E5X22_20170 [Mesorhizobium sp.]
MIKPPTLLLRIAKFTLPFVALLVFAELFPTAMTMLAEQSAERGMIAQAQSSAAEHYLSTLLDRNK